MLELAAVLNDLCQINSFSRDPLVLAAGKVPPPTGCSVKMHRAVGRFPPNPGISAGFTAVSKLRDPPGNRPGAPYVNGQEP